MIETINFASQIRRIFAKLFDLIIILTVFGISSIFFIENKEEIKIWIPFLITLLYFFLFQIIFPFLNNGKTIGKYIFKIKIISRINKKISFSLFLTRELFIFLPLFLGYFILNITNLFLKNVGISPNNKKDISDLFLKTITTINTFWFIFIFIFQKTNPLNRLFYDKYWDVLVVSETSRVFKKTKSKINIKIAKIDSILIETKKKEVNSMKNTHWKQNLNENQLKASLVSDQKNLRIIAGPGTGKTTVLVSRILNFIKNKKLDSKKILILTFTKKACKNISDRIKEEIPNFKEQQTFTYHSFCFRFLSEEINYLNFSKNKNLIILDQTDQKQIVKNIIKEMKTTLFGKVVDTETLKYILDLLNKTKLLTINNFDVFDKELSKLDSDLNNEQISFLWNLRNQYKNYKKKYNLLDFSDLLEKTYFILKNNPSLLKKWKRRYLQILIDEFQDINRIQYFLIKLLSNNGKDIKVSVVGDPDQTIYGWRDADIEYILNFDKVFDNTETIVLDKNYRSTKNIVELSNSFIKTNVNRIDKEIVFTKKSGSFIELLIESDYEQSRIIASKINDLIKNGVSPREITILYRSHYLSGKLEKELIENRIKYYIFKGIRFFARREIKDFFILLSLLINENEFEVEQVLLWVKDLGIKTLKKIKDEAKSENLTLLKYISIISEKSKFNKLVSNINEIFNEIFILKNTINEVKSFSFLSKIIFEKIYFKILNKLYFNEKEKIKNIKILLNMIESFEIKNNSLKIKQKILNFLNLTKISVSDDFIERGNSINLMTIHNTKGLEFDHVFIFNVSEGIFPTKQTTTFNKLEEERRLMFVAMTRARKTLLISSDYNYSTFIKELQKHEQINIIDK